MNNNPTFSQLHRAFRCRLSSVLPVVETVTEPSRLGTARHKFFERVNWHLANSLKDSSVDLVPVSLMEARELALDEMENESDYEALSAILVDSLQLSNVASEVTLAFDLETGKARELGRNLGRNYAGAKPTEIVGTVDRLALVDDGVYIGDYKGQGYKKAIEEDEQLLAGALAATRLYDRSWAKVEVLRVFGSEIYPLTCRYDVFQLDLFEVQLQELIERIEADRAGYQKGILPPATVGDHCQYCASLSYCPAKMSLASSLASPQGEMMELVKKGAALLSPANAAKAYRWVQDAQHILTSIEGAIEDYARQTPIDLGDGRVYGVDPNAKSRRITDSKKALDAIREIYGDHAQAAEKTELTWSGIDRATRSLLGKTQKRGDLKKYEQQVEELLLKRGLLKVEVGGAVREFKPKG